MSDDIRSAVAYMQAVRAEYAHLRGHDIGALPESAPYEQAWRDSVPPAEFARKLYHEEPK